jgi:hypothetical protein
MLAGHVVVEYELMGYTLQLKSFNSLSILRLGKFECR